jgi:FMN phosphatase YigB (HAD superfamily)
MVNFTSLSYEVFQDNQTSAKLDALFYSFDVFDTVITRLTGSPDSVFLLLGKQLLRSRSISCSAEVFARYRISAERATLKNIRERTILSDIYRELQSSLNLAPEQCKAIADAELQLQQSLLRPIPCQAKSIHKLRQDGHNVHYISDMHLPSAFIENILTDCDLWQPGDRLYVSCEHGKSKSNGALFKTVLEHEGILFYRSLFARNFANADVTAAEKADIANNYFLDVNLNRYEDILESYTWATEGFSSVMAGASRLSRLSIPVSNPVEQGMRDVAAGVVAPLIVGYVLWVLRRAHSARITRLYFLSRDGEILLQVARKLCEKLDLQIELRYLHASRLSWNLPMLESLDESWLWSQFKGYSFTISPFLERIGLTYDDVAMAIASAGLGIDDLDRKLNADEVRRFKAGLEECDAIAILKPQLAQQRELLLNYLRQEGLLDLEPKALVDVGWSSSLHTALCRLLRDCHGVEEPAAFYFGLSNLAPMHGNLEAYLFDKRMSLGYNELPYWGAIEIFCTGSHGTVLRFEKKGDRVAPVLEREYNSTGFVNMLSILRRTVNNFIENLLLDETAIDFQADIRYCSAKVFEMFWFQPTDDEAKVWSMFPWETHFARGGSHREYWAMAYKLKHLLPVMKTGEFPKHHRSSWIYGSLVLTPRYIRTILCTAKSSRNVLVKTMKKTKTIILDLPRTKKI